MRALHLVKTGVGATWALRQMRELVRLGVETHVALPPGAPLAPAYESAGIIVHAHQFDLPVGRPSRIPGVIRRLRGLVGQVQPDLIHSHFVGTTLTMRLALGRRHPIPRLFQVPGPLHLEHALFRHLETRSAGLRDFWIGSCKKTCDIYRGSGIAADRVFLSYYGMDLSTAERGGRPTLRTELGLSRDRPLVGMVAHIYPPKWYLGQLRGIKGHEDFIDAVAICLGRVPDLTGVIIGGPWGDARSYEQRLRRLGQGRCGSRLVFLGNRPDLSCLYPDLDIAVHPSLSENVGGASESLLHGVPTISTNVGGLPDVVRHGETGWLVPPRDPQRLAATIIDVLQLAQPGRAVALNGQRWVRDLLDVRRTADEVVRIYRRILRQAPAAPRMSMAGGREGQGRATP